VAWLDTKRIELYFATFIWRQIIAKDSEIIEKEQKKIRCSILDSCAAELLLAASWNSKDIGSSTNAFAREATWSQCYKTFFFHNLQFFCNELECFSQAGLFGLVWCFRVRPNIHEWGPFRFSNIGQAPELPSIIGQCWKGLPGTNTPVYYKHWYIMEEKSFIILVPPLQVHRSPLGLAVTHDLPQQPPN
jgi:hypothetical protein